MWFAMTYMILTEFAAAQATFWRDMGETCDWREPWDRMLYLCDEARHCHWLQEISEFAKDEAGLIRKMLDSSISRDHCDRIRWLCDHARDDEALTIVAHEEGFSFEPQAAEVRYQLWNER